MYLLYLLSDSGALALTFIIILAMIGIIVLLFLSVKKEFMRTDAVEGEDTSGLASRGELVKSMADFVVKYRRNNEFSLFYIELENFKNLKDLFGVKQSEKFKREFIENVSKVLPHNAMFSHFGGSEYMILLRGRISEEKLGLFAEKILAAIEKPIRFSQDDDGIVTFNPYMGIVIYPLNGTTEKELFNNAELALYISKKDGARKYTMFSDDLSKNENSNLAYYREIKEAIRKKEFTLYYQPVIDIEQDNVVSVESFIRWNHPTLGVLAPNKFLTIMEHSGDINWVGRWGIEELCIQYLEWSKKLQRKDLVLSFNLSPKQLLDPKIAEDFLAVAKSYHVNPQYICLEIVEFAMFEKYGIVAENIQKLSSLGFQIAIDDFGVEANTLARLTTLPLQMVKLDRKFIENSKDNFVMTKILEMLVDIGEKSNIKVVAEGVEDLDVLNQLRTHKIKYAQGYMFTKPLHASGILEYISKEQWKEATKL